MHWSLLEVTKQQICMKYCSSVLYYQLLGSWSDVGHCVNLWFTSNKATALLPTNLSHVPDRTTWALAGLMLSCLGHIYAHTHARTYAHTPYHLFHVTMEISVHSVENIPRYTAHTVGRCDNLVHVYYLVMHTHMKPDSTVDTLWVPHEMKKHWSANLAP